MLTSSQLCQQEYGSHPEFSDAFKQLLDEITEEFGPLPEQDSAPSGDNDSKPNKTGTEGDGQNKDGRPIATPHGARKRKNTGGDDSNKKAKIDSAKIKKVEDVGTAGALVEANLVNSKAQGVCLHIKPQNKVYIFNQGKQIAMLKNGMILCGFGKGKWHLQEAGKEADFNPAKEVLYNLESPDTLAPRTARKILSYSMGLYGNTNTYTNTFTHTHTYTYTYTYTCTHT